MVDSKKPSGQFGVKQKHMWQFLILVATIIVVNVGSDSLYKRFDLTKEKRYTLSQTTHDLVDKLDEPLYIQIFLDGEFPQEYRRLRNATQDLLNEYQHISNGQLIYRFEDLLTDKPIKEKDDILKQLSTKGVQITRPEIGQDQATSEKFIIPAGLVNYKGKEYPLNLLKREFGQPLEEDINGSIELLEYEIGNVIRKCVVDREIKIAFTQGHGELEPIYLADITQSLEEFYTVEGLNINLTDTACSKQFIAQISAAPDKAGEILLNGVMNQMNTYQALIIAKPRISFLDEELFLLDQYVMNGGKLIWLAEPLIAEMDSVAKYGSIMTADYNLNVNDLLFRYGVRINPSLIQDLNCHGIPVLAKGASGQPGFLPWLFYPIFAPQGEHPIIRNMTSVWGRFAAGIDTLPNSNAKKTVLLQSSNTSRIANNPVNVSLELLSLKPTPEMFRHPNNIAAVLVEGQFKSLYAHRRSMKQRSPIPFKSGIENNAMIVISDGDLIANQTDKEKKQVYPLGYDKYASKAFKEPVEFANKKFFLNCVDYLCDESNLIDVRSKKIELRLLDKGKIQKEKTKWQLINMVLPLVLLFIFGLINAWIRRRKYA
ncbi:MAG: gliding motility-associated ABC transporter substrate-binding protein GldG [Bacteroidetes bacterium]|jgi:ABC-2 type transport system permease protein|nr:gliding motility-associated ABC transporter substrate-binding protein GldG [Bacteroidota bacterium]